jgi:urease accessory protein
MIHPSAAGRRADPAHYTPANLPAEFAPFETPVEGLGWGQTGKFGLLELTFAPLGGATRITQQFQQFPLQVFRPFHLDPHDPATAFVFVMSHGSVVQGDRARLDLTCEPEARVHVTTQSAGKIYRMERNYATQLVNLDAGAGSFLEYLPDPLIPFRDARFFSRLSLTVHPTATAIIGETLLPGRVAYGENHDYSLFVSQLEARSPEGRLLFADTLRLAPALAPLQTPGRLGTHAVPASLYVVSQLVPAPELAGRLHDCLAGLPGVTGGASELPNGCGAWVRILGGSSSAVQAAQQVAWNEARLALTGFPAPDRRKT